MSLDKDVEILGPSHMADRNGECEAPLENMLDGFINCNMLRITLP